MGGLLARIRQEIIPRTPTTPTTTTTTPRPSTTPTPPTTPTTSTTSTTSTTPKQKVIVKCGSSVYMSRNENVEVDITAAGSVTLINSNHSKEVKTAAMNKTFIDSEVEDQVIYSVTESSMNQSVAIDARNNVIMEKSKTDGKIVINAGGNAAIIDIGDQESLRAAASCSQDEDGEITRELLEYPVLEQSDRTPAGQ